MSPGWSSSNWGNVNTEGYNYGSRYGVSDVGTSSTDEKDCCIIVNIIHASLDINNIAGTSTGTREYTIKGDINTIAKKYCLKADYTGEDSDLGIIGPVLRGKGGDLGCLVRILSCKSGSIPMKYSFECVPGSQQEPSRKKLHLYSAEWFPCSVPCESEVSPGWVQPCECTRRSLSYINTTLKWNMFPSHLGGLVSLAGLFGGVPQGISFLGGVVNRGLNCTRRFFEKLAKKKIKIGPKIDCNCDPMMEGNSIERDLPIPEIPGSPLLPDFTTTPGIGPTIDEAGRVLTGGGPPCPPPSQPCDC